MKLDNYGIDSFDYGIYRQFSGFARVRNQNIMVFVPYVEIMTGGKFEETPVVLTCLLI